MLVMTTTMMIMMMGVHQRMYSNIFSVKVKQEEEDDVYTLTGNE